MTLFRVEARKAIQVPGPTVDLGFGIRVEADSSVPEDEVWFVLPSGEIEKVKVLTQEEL